MFNNAHWPEQFQLVCPRARKPNSQMIFNGTVVAIFFKFQVLLRCRAIDNQCYVIAAAQTGQHNAKRRSYGHAMVCNATLRIGYTAEYKRPTD